MPKAAHDPNRDSSRRRFDDSELLLLEKQILAQLRLARTPEVDAEHDAAVERMFAISAHTAEGRGAKASVVLGIMADCMMCDPVEGDYPLDLVRALMVEIGGKPAQVPSCES